MRSMSAVGQAGQIVLEYLILFSVVLALTLVSVTRFDDNIRATLQEFLNAAAIKIAN